MCKMCCTDCGSLPLWLCCLYFCPVEVVSDCGIFIWFSLFCLSAPLFLSLTVCLSVCCCKVVVVVVVVASCRCLLPGTECDPSSALINCLWICICSRRWACPPLPLFLSTPPHPPHSPACCVGAACCGAGVAQKTGCSFKYLMKCCVAVVATTTKKRRKKNWLIMPRAQSRPSEDPEKTLFSMLYGTCNSFSFLLLFFLLRHFSFVAPPPRVCCRRLLTHIACSKAAAAA